MSKLLGLEVVRLGACLNRVTRPYCFNSAQPLVVCAGTLGLPRQRESENHQLGKEHTAQLSSAGWVQSHLQGKVAQTMFPGPSLFLSRLPYSVKRSSSPSLPSLVSRFHCFIRIGQK